MGRREGNYPLHIVYIGPNSILSLPSHPRPIGPGRHGNGIVYPISCLVSTCVTYCWRYSNGFQLWSEFMFFFYCTCRLLPGFEERHSVSWVQFKDSYSEIPDGNVPVSGKSGRVLVRLIKQDRQWAYNLMLRLVLGTIIAVEKQ
jgi:hypothetical protein